MLFNSFIFLIFLGVVLPIFYLLPRKEHKNLFLLLVSYFFYGYWDWRFCFLLAISTIADFAIGRAIHRSDETRRRKLLLLTSLSINLGILGFFKYFNFFIDSFETAFSIFGANFDFLHLNIILPVGISFYTFQTLSYTLDIYRRKLKPSSNFIDFALFVAFFPQLVAGPIERARHLLPQLSVRLHPTREQVSEGVVLIITGLFMKVMIGDAGGRIADHIFTNPEYYSSLEFLCALLIFSVQIYADFSGYSNIARGTAKLLGVDLMRNFAQPYLSANISEFWRRWHISLSSWLRDYLYISLGGNRKGRGRTFINLMLTMLLGGLWHGANWTFVIWGALHGTYLVIHKLILGDRKPQIHYTYAGVPGFLNYFVKALLTYILVLLTWLFFRAENLQQVALFFQMMAEFTTGDYAVRIITITSTFMIVTLIYDILQYRFDSDVFLLKLRSRALTTGILGGLFLTTLLYMFVEEPLPFVYFQF